MDQYKIKKAIDKFYVGESHEKSIAHIAFEYQKDNVIVVYETFVSPELRGKGIAAKLLDEIVKMARKDNLKVIPTCTYAISRLSNNDEFKDILHET